MSLTKISSKIQICIKRGVLGKCIKAEVRTAKNDNDKATQYFSNIVKTNSDNLVENTYESNNENSELIKKLRQQTEDNKEKNARIVKQKTMMNDAVRICKFIDFIIF